jgi:hypothetical protein
VCDEILLHQLLKNPVAKMRTTITDNRSMCTKPSKNRVLQKFDHNSVVIGLACNCLHPFGHIVHSNQNVQKPKGVWERSHEIDAPYIKNLNYQYGIEGVSYFSLKYSRVSGNAHMKCNKHNRLQTWWANKIHTAKSLQQFCLH